MHGTNLCKLYREVVSYVTMDKDILVQVDDRYAIIWELRLKFADSKVDMMFRTAGNKEAERQPNILHCDADDPDDVALDLVSADFVETVNDNQSRIRLESKCDSVKEARHRRDLLDGFDNEDFHLFFSSL